MVASPSFLSQPAWERQIGRASSSTYRSKITAAGSGLERRGGMDETSTGRSGVVERSVPTSSRMYGNTANRTPISTTRVIAPCASIPSTSLLPHPAKPVTVARRRTSACTVTSSPLRTRTSILAGSGSAASVCGRRRGGTRPRTGMRSMRRSALTASTSYIRSGRVSGVGCRSRRSGLMAVTACGASALTRGRIITVGCGLRGGDR